MQIYFRLYYFTRARARKLIGFNYPLSKYSNSTRLKLDASIDSYISYDNYQFSFLNLTKSFSGKIDWNYNEYGKLWTYNLTYFDYLHQKNMSKNDGLKLIYDFMEQGLYIKDGLEPFPISLRGINWIKFLSYNEVKDQKIDDTLYAQYQILIDNLEYHLLGNHLLENGFSLLYGAYYFQDQKLYAKAKKILTDELDEQILQDGAHFELSPMYHQIMLFRILDCVNLVQNNNWKNQELLELLTSKAKLMFAWLNTITFENGDIPLLNDSTNNIAPTTEQLNDYSSTLQITNFHQLSAIIHQLNESGYRKIKNNNYEIIVDVGKIGPDYIPGHAHADTFSFELYITPSTINYRQPTKIPFIIDTGLSTYETNERRTKERSTAAHNTVEIMNTSSSEVWGGFRVADRAYVTEIKESTEKIVATHNGYNKKFDLLHTRAWQFKEDKIIIRDTLSKAAKAVARLHFHPDVTEEMILERIEIHNSKFRIRNYKYASAFNRHLEAKVLEVTFEKKLQIEIKL